MSEVSHRRLSTCCMRRAMNCPTLTDPVATGSDPVAIAPGTDLITSEREPGSPRGQPSRGGGTDRVMPGAASDKVASFVT